MNHCEYLHDLWRRKIGLPELNRNMPSLKSLQCTEWSPEFEAAMRVRMVMGAFRYGLLHAEDKPAWDRMSSIERRVALYRKTKNKECLVDIANLCLLEFEEGEGNFSPVDDGEHVTV